MKHAKIVPRDFFLRRCRTRFEKLKTVAAPTADRSVNSGRSRRKHHSRTVPACTALAGHLGRRWQGVPLTAAWMGIARAREDNVSRCDQFVINRLPNTR